MILDVTGIELTPGNNGNDCVGNGKHLDKNGNIIECCCNECNYMICCTIMANYDDCKHCSDKQCPNFKVNKT